MATKLKRVRMTWRGILNSGKNDLKNIQFPPWKSEIFNVSPKRGKTLT